MSEKKVVKLSGLTLNNKTVKSELDKKVEKIFDNEYKQQLKNTLIQEFTALQYKLSKEVTPWIEQRGNDYHVQRYLLRENESEKEQIVAELRTKALKLLTNVLSISNIKKL